MDLLWLLFLAGLAVLYPRHQINKQLVLVGIGVFQLLENRLVAFAPGWGRHASVLVKLLLATLLMLSTTQGRPAITSSYYPIYYLPVVTAAVYFGPWLTMLWTTVAAGAFCSLLVPALHDYQLTADAISEGELRHLIE